MGKIYHSLGKRETYKVKHSPRPPKPLTENGRLTLLEMKQKSSTWDALEIEHLLLGEPVGFRICNKRENDPADVRDLVNLGYLIYKTLDKNGVEYWGFAKEDALLYSATEGNA